MVDGNRPQHDTGRARALEVVARLGDSIVDVAHLGEPAPRATLVPRGSVVVALGVVCMVVALASFASAVRLAARDAASYARWTAAHKPAFAFRPHRLGVEDDLATAGGFAAGLALLAVGLARRANARSVPHYRIGRAPGVELACAGPAPSFPLVAREHGGFVLHVVPGMVGELVDGDGAHTLAESAREAPVAAWLPNVRAVALARDARVRVRVGCATISIAACEAPRTPASASFTLFERRSVAYFAASLAAHLAVLALLDLLPVDAGAATIEIAAREAVVVHAQTAALDQPSARRVDAGRERALPPAELALPALPALPRVATTPRAPTSAAMQLEHEAADDGGTAREQAVTSAREAGILGVLATSSAAMMSSITTQDLEAGFDDHDVNHVEGGFEAANGRDGSGGFGMARVALAAGRGTTIAAGRYQTIGHGVHVGEDLGLGGYGVVGGIGAAKQHVETVLTVTMCGCGVGCRDHWGDGGCVNVEGTYDKAIIRRYVQRRLDQIAYCYERETIEHPQLAGELKASWVITEDGHVEGASAVGFDQRVGACVADVISKIQFPATHDGGSVAVNYPFVFHL